MCDQDCDSDGSGSGSGSGSDSNSDSYSDSNSNSNSGSDSDSDSDSSSTFEQTYRCYPVSAIKKPHLEKGDKIIMPPSALYHLDYLQIDYPMLFQLSSPAGKVSHCGVLEFVADEGMIYLPQWMMENMVLQEGDIVNIRNASLSKGTYVKLQPHTTAFIDLSNLRAILETTLRSYSCLTKGDTIMIAFNNKKFYIDIVDTKPSSAISIIDTDCEVDFAPPLDYKELERPVRSNPPNKTLPEEPAKEIPKFSPFTGSANRLDGKPLIQSDGPDCSPIIRPHQAEATNGTHGPTLSKRPGKLVFGSNGDQVPNVTPPKVTTTRKDSNQEPPQKVEEPKFQAFTGKKYSLKG